MSQGGANNVTGSGGDPVETLTGNSGGAVGPDGAFNIDVLGNNLTGIDVVGTPASNLLTVIALASSTTQVGTVELATAVETGTLTDATLAITPAGLAPILTTPYVVAPGGAYTTIQSALDAANATGGGLIFVRGGVYVEDLTCYPNITITGPGITSGYPGGVTALEIQGNHTPATTGIMTFNNVTFTTAVGDTFNSAAAGTAELNFTNCGCGVTNGYFLNVPNWTGVLSFWDFNPGLGTNDGGINNPTGGASVYCYEAGVGIGTTQTMQISGTIIFNQGEILCPIQFNTGSSGSFSNDNFGNTITLANNTSLEFNHCFISSGANAAITMSSSATNTFSNCVIDSSNNPAIAGAGAGTLSLTNISFLNDQHISNTLTLSNGAINTGAQIYPITSLDNGDTPYTALDKDSYFSCDTALGVLTIRLPNAPPLGRVYTVKDSTASAAAFNITVTTVGGVVNIDGAATFVMNTNYQAANFIYNGSSYEVF